MVSSFISFLSVDIGILIRSAAWYNRIKQRRSWLVFGWVTVLVCQFLVMIFSMRLLTEALGAALAVQFSTFFLFFCSFFCNASKIWITARSKLMNDFDIIISALCHWCWLDVNLSWKLVVFLRTFISLGILLRWHYFGKLVSQRHQWLSVLPKYLFKVKVMFLIILPMFQISVHFIKKILAFRSILI